ncbi:hypothetical protein [Streptomyces sp. Amel2xC10]|uniref:hypothetical protein n=1 Tax=Streptomyces sp. Amel2xC10 TaxID=1305826 RepID=UPI00117DFE0B|nr:hypothetical protein [Streptomyces sp. Amel2xC10]
MLGAAILLASGCSKPGYDYAIPTKLCGIKVDESTLKPILPHGKEGRAVDPGTNDFYFHNCSIIVDKKRALNVSIMRDTEGRDIDDFLPYWKKEFKNLKTVSSSGDTERAGVGDNGAAAKIKCRPKPGHLQKGAADIRHTHLMLRIHLGDGADNPEETADRRAAMERFMRSYIPGLTEAWCK